MATSGITVVGLKSLLKDLRAADRALPRTVTKSIKGTAERVVLPDARGNIGGQPVPNIPNMLKASGTTRGAFITIRNSAYPFAAGAESGAKQYGQFKPWVGNQYSAKSFPGYMVGPAINTNLTRMETEWLDDVTKALGW